MKTGRALVVGLLVIVAGIVLAQTRVNPYFYFAGYVILQYIVIATAWNILGGYAGYVNFGTPAFFALGAYTAVFLIRSVKARAWASRRASPVAACRRRRP
jgi:branched-chain amino acid transport system permease protein